ncbi:MAG: hypothetical protein HKO54_03525 [Flavobacteriaceae bacterium]|nr:hypothetical protein [Flavobacteriaceae bacterium]
MKKIFLLLMIGSSVLSCKNKPKEITATTSSENSFTPSGIFSEDNIQLNPDFERSDQGSFAQGVHTVIPKEVLATERYVYIRVTEQGKEYWIASLKQPIELGKTYYYRDGLLKTRFESKEYNRMFDSIYLVSNLVSHNHGVDGVKNEGEEVVQDTYEQKKDIPTHTEEIIQHKGSIKISELVANPEKYEGKTVQLTGKCVKVNPNIMNRNWIHLQDGSKNDFDLVITSNTFVAEGQIVTIRAEVSLDRDFGAGYAYPLLLENGIVVE